MGPSSFAAIALQSIAAHCVANRKIPVSVWQPLRDVPSLGSDSFTLNALAWMADAVRARTCNDAERAQLQQLIAALASTSTAWNPGRQQLRDQHLRQLLGVAP
jgi:hypothetical protein